MNWPSVSHKIPAIGSLSGGTAETGSASYLGAGHKAGALLKAVLPAICLCLFAIGAGAEEAAAPDAAADASILAEAGREIFNSTCAHCHGPDAVHAESRIDLRLLHRKYGGKMEATFFETVNAGRPSKGMPSWKYVFTPDQITAVFAYLKTVQSD